MALLLSRDNKAYLFDIPRHRKIVNFEGHFAQIVSVNFSSDGRQVVTGSFDHTARIWDTSSGHETFRFEGHSAEVESATFSSDGQFVLTCSNDGTAKLLAAR